MRTNYVRASHYRIESLVIAAAIGAAAVAQAPQTMPPQPADLTVPAGFTASVFASDLAGARLMTVSPEGTLHKGFIYRISYGRQ